MKTRVVFLSLLLASACSLPSLHAQTKRKPKKRTSTPVTVPKSDAADETRVRRTGETVPGEVSPTAGTKPQAKVDSTPSANANPATDTPTAEDTTKSAAPAAATASAVTEDPPVRDELETLRNQIEEAATAQEKIGLQLKFVEALVNANKRPEAISQLHSIVDTDVFDPQGFYNVGNSFVRLGETEGAIQAYRKAIEQKKGRYSRAYNNLGVVLLRAGRWEESYDALMSALKLENFRYPEASYNLGRLYAARGQNDLAIREWRRVLAQNPEHKAAAEAVARIGGEGRVVVDPNRITVTKSVTVTPAREKVSSPKSSPPSEMRSSKTLALDQESFDLLQRARTATEKGNSADAIGSYQRLLLRQGGYFPPANLELSFALLSSKRYDEAMGNLQMVASRDGVRYPIAYFHIARVYELQGDLKSAEEFFSKTASLFGSQNGQFLLDVSRVREKKGDFKGALDAMEQYLALLKKQGVEPAWSDERLASLRQKLSATPK